MGKPHPFYRFEPARANAGFGNLAGYISQLLIDLHGEFTNGQNIGQSLGKLLAAIQVKIDEYNATPYFGGFELVKPKPFPALSGVQTITLTIQNPQLFATYSTQFIEVSVGLNGLTITSSTFTANPLVLFTGDYSEALFPEEVKAGQSILIKEQSGAAIFPDTYDIQGNIAVSGLARCMDVTYSERFGTAIRTPEQTLPAEPVYRFSLRELDSEESFFLTVLGKIVRKGFQSGITRADIITYAALFVRPSGWSFTAETDSTNKVEFTWSTSNIGLRISGIETGGVWLWQRFVCLTEPDASIFIQDFAGLLPYEPNTGLMYNSIWYDIEFVDFEACPTPGETYQGPIKPGDTYQFNVPLISGNLSGLESCLVGLLDSDGNFVGQIGTAELPLADSTQLGFYDSNGVLQPFLTIKPGFNTGPSEVDGMYFYFFDSDGGVGAGLGLLARSDIYACTSTADFADLINDFAWPEDLIVVATVNDDQTITINCTYTGAECFLGIGAYTFFEGSGETSYWFRVTEANTTVGAQFQATALIPAISEGCYRICLYGQGAYTEDFEIYAVSNALQYREDDCFSTLVEFWDSGYTIREGFEYLYGWKQIARIDLNGGGETIQIEESIYRNSDGTYQRPMSNSDKSVNLQTDYIDLNTQNALFAATRHPAFVWNGQNIFVSGELEVATTQDNTTESTYRNLSMVKFQALLQGFQPDNNACIGC
jgi:hypothetical protein